MRVFVPIMQDPNTEQRFVEVDLILAGEPRTYLSVLLDPLTTCQVR